jgi:hypothetical protein
MSKAGIDINESNADKIQKYIDNEIGFKKKYEEEKKEGKVGNLEDVITGSLDTNSDKIVDSIKDLSKTIVSYMKKSISEETIRNLEGDEKVRALQKRDMDNYRKDRLKKRIGIKNLYGRTYAFEDKASWDLLASKKNDYKYKTIKSLAQNNNFFFSNLIFFSIFETVLSDSFSHFISV